MVDARHGRVAGAGVVTLAMLAAMALPGTGRAKARRLAAGIHPGGGAEAALRALSAHVGKRGDADAAWRAAVSIVAEAADLGQRVVGMMDDGYPDRFARMPDPPCVLFVLGDPLALSRRNALAMVGTREPTDYGARVARKTGALAAEAGFTVVSGLAAGIDQEAHRGCVEAGGVGVAVMAHGLHTVQPRSADGLARDLLAAGGCLVSEYAPGTDAKPHRFVERDRLQSALSDGVFVVETTPDGGTMHTVRAAEAQGRALACLGHGPAHAGTPQAEGNRRVAAFAGAVVVRNGVDLSAWMATLGPFGLGRREAGLPLFSGG